MRKEVQREGKPKRDPDGSVFTQTGGQRRPLPPIPPWPGSKRPAAGASTLTGPTGTSSWAGGVGEANVGGGEKVPQIGHLGSKGLISLPPLIVSVILDRTIPALGQDVLNSWGCCGEEAEMRKLMRCSGSWRLGARPLHP